MSARSVVPHGGSLVDLVVGGDRRRELTELSRNCLSLDLSLRGMCDLELLLNGGFSPLQGFLNQKDYESVCNAMRFSNGTLWPIPIVLDVPEQTAKRLSIGSDLASATLRGLYWRSFV